MSTRERSWLRPSPPRTPHKSSARWGVPMNTFPTTYAIRVDGHLDEHWSPWLGDLDMTRDDDGTSTITVSVADQAQLHGVLARLRDIGAVIIELHTAGAPVLKPPAAA